MEKIDRPLLFLTLILMLLGLLFVYSSSYYIAMRMTSNPYYFTIRQIIWTFLSVVILFLFIRIDYLKLKKFVKPLVFFTIFMLLLVFIPALSRESGGARRWLDFRLFSFNPSEMAKLTVIIYLSFILTKKQSKLEDFTFGILPPLLLVAAIFFIILMQLGFSTASLLLLVAFIMFFVGGATVKHVVSIFILSLPILATVIFQVSYRKARVLSFINPWDDPSGRGYHILQSLKSFSDAGLFGLGLGNSIQKMGHLPTPHTDFIFSVITEETGLIGATILIILYIAFFIRGIFISRNCKEPFGQMLAFGITSLITIHAVLNMGIAAGIVPPTGVSLPFISSGGSSMLILAIGVGILLNISSQNPDADRKPARQKVSEIIQDGFGAEDA